MTLQDLGNVSQIVSAIAVVVSLVYLAIQIRTGSRIARLALQEDFVATQQETMMRLAESPELYRIWRLGSTTPEAMSDEERERFGMMMFAQMYRHSMMFQAAEMEPLAEERAILQIDLLAALPAFQAWWRRQQHLFAYDPRFVSAVDARIARSGAGRGSEPVAIAAARVGDDAHR